jgi:3-dehydroquinate dehydratase/shikimate dehydrogenase
VDAKHCITVTGRTMAELRKRRDEVTDADLVELRLDTVDDPNAAAALAGRTRPVIVTCRAAWEGGHFKGAEEERRRLLCEAQRLGAEYIDVEWKAGFDELLQARQGKGVVLSMHDFQGVPADLSDRAQAMRATGAEVVKLAVTARRLSDALVLLPLANNAVGQTVLLAMGEAGIPSRVLAARFGSVWTYAGDGVAPGQIPASRLCQDFAFARARAGTAIYGVVGRPVMHSLSPAMHNAAFAAADIDAVYLPLPASDFNDFLSFAEALSIAGVSVTAPFKVDAFAHADADEISRCIGTVNTLRRCGGRWLAINTDGAGFLAPLAQRMPPAGRRVTVLGAGGAARAVTQALRSVGARVSIAARHRDRAARVAAMTGALVTDWPPAASWDILVNATPVGTVPALEESPLPEGPFTGELVYDLVYNPPDTKLLRDARAAGCGTIGGLEMLVAQAERQFDWWTGREPAPGVMHAAASRTLSTLGTLGTLGTP